MPTGLHRYQEAGNSHFLTFSCYHRRPYFGGAHARDVFEQCLEACRAKYEFVISAYVVMPEHVHLLVTEPPATPLSTAIQSLKIRVAKSLPESPFWQRRYYDFNVVSERKWAEKVLYTHWNPVKRKLVRQPQDWPWSSARTYETMTCRVVRLESFYAARQDPKLNFCETDTSSLPHVPAHTAGI
jgi:putative transposase